MADQTYAQFAAADPIFRQACVLAGVEPTKRQAGKWLHKEGQAYQKRQEVLNATRQEKERGEIK